MKGTWFDLPRFASRRYLGGFYEQHRVINGDSVDFADDAAALLQARWAGWLNIDADDLLLAATAHDAWHLLANALLLPDDVVLIAEPTLSAFPAAALAAGAAYVDVGRSHNGEVPFSAWQLALQHHPQALIMAEFPSLYATDDLVALTELHGRFTLVDATQSEQWAGPRAQPLAVGSAMVVALRDPDAPQAPVLHAIVCAPATGRSLRQLQGPLRWPEVLLRQALGVLAGLHHQPQWPLAVEQEMHEKYTLFADLARAWPGAVVLPRAGMRAGVLCMAGDAAALALHLQPKIFPLFAYGTHPMRDLLLIDLTQAAVRK